MRRRSAGGFAAACEDVGVAVSGGICAVCHRSKIRGHRNDSGDVFICTQCQADAAKFIAIQDTIIDEADQAAAVRRNSAERPHQRRSQR